MFRHDFNVRLRYTPHFCGFVLQREAREQQGTKPATKDHAKERNNPHAEFQMTNEFNFIIGSFFNPIDTSLNYIH